jgi:hypothetical protein
VRDGAVANQSHAAPTSDLFSAAAFTRHLERAYEQAVARSRAGLAPEDIVV